MIARRIIQLQQEMKIWDKGQKYRPVEFRDIVVLLRSTKTQRRFLEEFRQMGLPAMQKQAGYFCCSRSANYLVFVKGN